MGEMWLSGASWYAVREASCVFRVASFTQSSAISCRVSGLIGTLSGGVVGGDSGCTFLGVWRFLSWLQKCSNIFL